MGYALSLCDRSLIARGKPARAALARTAAFAQRAVAFKRACASPPCGPALPASP
jgi:hypothetical protein